MSMTTRSPSSARAASSSRSPARRPVGLSRSWRARRSHCTTSTEQRLETAERIAADVKRPDRRRGFRIRVRARAPRRARRRRLRRQRDPGRRLRRHVEGLRDPGALRVRQTIGDTIGVGGVFRGAADDPGAARRSPTTCRGVPGRDPAQLHQPDGDAHHGRCGGHRAAPTRSSACATRCRTPTSSSPRSSACPSTRSTTRPPASTTRRSCCSFERDGESLYPLLDEAIERDPDGLGRRVRIELYRAFGYFPTESSEHCAEYVPWFMRHDDQLERFRIPVDEYIRRSLENIDEYDEVRQRGWTTAAPMARRARVSWRRATSTRWSPASRGSSTETSATTG